MEKATISQLKNRLSAYLQKVRGGVTIIVFDRNEPVARIENIRGAGEADDRLARLERTGVIRRAARPLSIEALESGAPRPEHSVVEALLEERRDSR